MTDELFPRGPVTVAPGAVHLPGWLDLAEQRELVDACREWARPPAGMVRHTTPGGGRMSVRMVSLGRHWAPYRYRRTLPDGEPVKPFPPVLGALAARGAAAAGFAVAERYDVALVNFYDADAAMGLHRDSDERSAAPVVSLSLGDACVFRFGNTERRGRPWTDVELRGGDLFVFGGPARLAYHGVPRIHPGTADPRGGLTSGRLNITIRVSGLGAGPG
ncbi:alpha-ketoglutarate-dependent dioxygenase AlkB family protein [Allonocardiopsis opalescens]|uniref:DNA-N1-methyladenine dioxygenase n=1 Tax=Allonocardiopsis opalescens TaxID=1144618 RepID=A0A2T0Q4Z4_9ACTN|nr:alpha-ketoglutarate-dependent dioxygenase AlkB [Allonocardiopsis opalescens]PRX98877.1 DNA-N1-methyladenine dioxygenase [Allonocardiopsis opalescens]